MMKEAIESGKLSAPRGRVADLLVVGEDADGSREGRDRGTHRFLKALTVLLRLKGFNSRDRMMPIREIELTGQPLMSFVPSARASAAPRPKLEPVSRCVELAVHLARSSNFVTAMHLGDCELTGDGGDKCVAELTRLVRQVGVGTQSRFLEEVDLHGNALDVDAVKKIVEAAVKERAEKPHAWNGAPPLWLDMSLNRVRNPKTVFENLQAWATWAHSKSHSLCLADQEGCTKKVCSKGCMVHMPRFLEQDAGEARPLVQVGSAGDDRTAASDSAALSTAKDSVRGAAVPKPRAWRDVEDLPRSSAFAATRPSEPGTRSRHQGRAASRSRRRRRRSRSPGGEGARAAAARRIVLKPGPGRAAGDTARSRSRPRHRSRRRRGRQPPSEVDEPPGSGQEDAGSGPGSAAGGSEAAGALEEDAEGEEEEEGSRSGSSDHSSAPSAAAKHPAPAAAGETSAEDLEARMNRLIASLKSSMVPASGPERRRPAPEESSSRRDRRRR